MAKADTFQIGVLSDRAQIGIETIRYYERIGLLPRPQRSERGYRRYAMADFERLTFIRRARDLGFSLEAVRQLLQLADQKSRSCGRVQKVAERHLGDVQAKLADLHRMESVLAAMVEKCARQTLPSCPLLETLNVRALEGGRNTRG